MAEAAYLSGGLKVELLAQGDTPTSVSVASVVQANLKEIGIESGIQVLSSAVTQEKRDLNHDYQIATAITPAHLPNPGHIFGLSYHSKGSRNYYEYNNPQVDGLLERAGNIYDQQERAVLYQQVTNIVADDLPFIITNTRDQMTLMSKKVRDYPRGITSQVLSYLRTWLAQ